MLTKRRRIYKPIEQFMLINELRSIDAKTLCIKFLIPYNYLKDLDDIQRINFVNKVVAHRNRQILSTDKRVISCDLEVYN